MGRGEVAVQFFVSYARRDVTKVTSLAGVLRRLGHEPWIDTNLAGGQAWWDEILSRIRQVDCFLIAVSASSLESQACSREREYAQRLGKPMLPVAVEKVQPELLPPDLAALQLVDYSTPGEDSAIQLAGALMHVSTAPALPDPLPTPPPVPVSYLSELSQRVLAPSLTLEEQRALVASLDEAVRRARLQHDDGDEAAALNLLRKIDQRADLYAETARRITEIAAPAASTPALRREAEPAPPPIASAAVEESRAVAPPQPPEAPKKTSRWVTALAVIGGIFLVLIALSVCNSTCYTDAFGNLYC